MYTTCPACQTVFRLTAATLRAAHGQVVCATCDTTFDALFGLSDEPPAGTPGIVRQLAPPAAETSPTSLPETPPTSVAETSPTSVEESPAAASASGLPADFDSELTLTDLPANPSLDQVAAALADAGVLLDELDDPSALDDVTLLHIPGAPRDAAPSGPPQVAQALADDAARHQRRTTPDALETSLAPEAAPQGLAGTFVELDDDDPTGTWAPLSTLPEPTPEPTPESEPVSFAAAMEAVSPHRATNLQGEPLPEAGTQAAMEAGAEEALEPWMDDAQPSPTRRWAWTLGSVGLLLLLGAQAAHHWREPLARHPVLGPAVVGLYTALGQKLPPNIDLLAYTVTQGKVDAAATAGALRVSAIITNRTRAAHARPLLQVTLEDRYGAPIGRRTFHPEEYSPPPASPLPPHGQLPAVVEVADPGSEAVGYKLDLCLEEDGVLHCASDPIDGSAPATP